MRCPLRSWGGGTWGNRGGGCRVQTEVEMEDEATSPGARKGQEGPSPGARPHHETTGLQSHEPTHAWCPERPGLWS